MFFCATSALLSLSAVGCWRRRDSVQADQKQSAGNWGKVVSSSFNETGSIFNLKRVVIVPTQSNFFHLISYQ